MKKLFFLMTIVIMMGFYLSADQAEDLLKQVEETLIGANAPKDISSLMQMTIHRGSDKKERQLLAWTKSNPGKEDWRVLKFQSPADVKGIALLVLADDQMYTYLPEFKRIRRIASSNKKDAFVGSDFSYEDLAATKFTTFYQARLLKEDNQHFYLELTLKPGFAKPYAKLEMTVVKATMLPENLKMFDKAGKLWKECGQRSQKIGQYNIIHYFSMQDLQKKSRTVLELREIKVDSGLDDEIFSERFLKK